MKKKYTKPAVEIMEINGNDIICGSCSSEGKTPVKSLSPSKYGALEFLLDTNGDGLTRDEFNQGFGETENCNPSIKAYCKFNSVGPNITQIAWS